MKTHPLAQALLKLATSLALLTPLPAFAADMVVYSNDFDNPAYLAPGLTATLAGGGPASVQGYAGIGPLGNQFSGNFWQNQGGVFSPTVLTLTGLPTHQFVDIGFLLAVIESWDGSVTSVAPDFFAVRVDGMPIFVETFDNFDLNDQSYVPPLGGLLTSFPFPNLIGSAAWPDSAYNMNLEPAFLSIPHTGSSLTVEWFTFGSGWQGGVDEYWALENLSVRIHAVPDLGLGTGVGFGIAALLLTLPRRRPQVRR